MGAPAVRAPGEAGGPRRSALVTGASSGIGLVFAEQLAREQYDLTLVARDVSRLEALARDLREARQVAAEVLPADLADPAGLSLVEARLTERAPDLLVNNAGFGTFGRFEDLDVAVEEAEIRLNVLAVMRLTHAVLPALVERGRGAVINVSSLAGEGPLAFNATYGGTKAFVTSFTLALAEELRGSGVRVQALLPGFTRTRFQERAGLDASAIPAPAWLEAETVVGESLAALERDQSLCIPGAAYKVYARAQRLIPRGILRRLTAAAVGRSLD